MLVRLRRVYTELSTTHNSDDLSSEQQDRAQMIEPGTPPSVCGAGMYSDTARPPDKSRLRAAVSGSQMQAKTALARLKISIEAPAIITSLERRARRKIACTLANSSNSSCSRTPSVEVLLRHPPAANPLLPPTQQQQQQQQQQQEQDVEQRQATPGTSVQATTYGQPGQAWQQPQDHDHQQQQQLGERGAGRRLHGQVPQPAVYSLPPVA